MTGLSDRFWAKVEKTDSCWTWRACLNSKGYGVVGIDRHRYLAHRVAYTDAYGSIPDDMTIDHLCRNKQCVRVDHMEIVTRAENGRRGRADQLARLSSAA